MIIISPDFHIPTFVFPVVIKFSPVPITSLIISPGVAICFAITEGEGDGTSLNIEGYSEMESFSPRPSAAGVSPETCLQDATEVTSSGSNQSSRLYHAPSALGRPSIPVSGTNSASTYVADDVNIPPYRAGVLGYAAHLSEIPTSGFTTDSARYASHLPQTSTPSAYDPRNFAFNPGGFPLQPRQELSYGHMQQSYINQSQSHQENLRTDTETYNAALALVQSQNKIFTDDTGGQYYQLGSTSTDTCNTNYEVVHTQLVSDSAQQGIASSGHGQSEKAVFVSEKPQSQIIQTQGTESENSNVLEATPEEHIEVVVETVELSDVSNKSSLVQKETMVLFKAEGPLNQNCTQLTDCTADRSVKVLNEKEIQEPLISFQKQTDENQDALTSTVNSNNLYKDTASQIEGPALESRFGVLLEEIRETPRGKSCCIKLKPIKNSYFDSSFNSIIFDIEIENDLNVSTIEKAYLTEKTSKYSFLISTQKNSEEITTSENGRLDNSDGVTNTHKPIKRLSLVSHLNKARTLVKEEKIEVHDKILTRASRRKMAKPLKKAALKKSNKSDSRKVKGQWNFNSKTVKERKNSKKDKEGRNKKPKSKSVSSKDKKLADHLDIEEEADRSDDYNASTENSADQDDFVKDSLVASSHPIADEGTCFTKVRTEERDRLEFSNKILAAEKNKLEKIYEETISDSGLEVISNQDGDGEKDETSSGKKKRKKKEGTAREEGRSKRKYTKRDTYNKTELNYTVRKTETGQRRFVCNICQYESKQTGNMRSHMRARHTEEKPFKCHLCEKQFSSQSNLRGHWSIHKDERPYLCSICGTAFKANSNLVKHIQRHLGDKRFACTSCGKQFVTSTDLRRHARVHSSEKSFLCELCPKSFKDATSLSRHSFCHTGEKNHLCTFCGEAFARKDNCYTHMKKHHAHETDILPPPPKRLEHYVNSPEPEDSKNKEIEPKPVSRAPVAVAKDIVTSQSEPVGMESHIAVGHMVKTDGTGTYTQLMAAEDMSTLVTFKLPQQQPYEMYMPMSMQGPSW